MSKFTDELNEMVNNRVRYENSPDGMAKQIEGTFEDILYQLEGIADMPVVNFNTSNKIRKHIVELRKLGFDISKDIKGKR